MDCGGLLLLYLNGTKTQRNPRQIILPGVALWTILLLLLLRVLQKSLLCQPDKSPVGIRHRIGVVLCQRVAQGSRQDGRQGK